MVLKSQLPHKIVNLLFELVIVNNKLKIQLTFSNNLIYRHQGGASQVHAQTPNPKGVFLGIYLLVLNVIV